MSQPKVYTTKVYSSITTAIIATDVAVKGDDEPDDDVLLSVDDGARSLRSSISQRTRCHILYCTA